MLRNIRKGIFWNSGFTRQTRVSRFGTLEPMSFSLVRLQKLKSQKARSCLQTEQIQQVLRCKTKLGSIYFHSALEGHKIDAIRNCAKASFCVIAADDVIPEKFTTAYRSVIVFGEVHVVKDDANRKLGLELLGRKYSPNSEEAMPGRRSRNAFDRTAIIELKD